MTGWTDGGYRTYRRDMTAVIAVSTMSAMTGMKQLLSAPG